MKTTDDLGQQIGALLDREIAPLEAGPFDDLRCYVGAPSTREGRRAAREVQTALRKRGATITHDWTALVDLADTLDPDRVRVWHSEIAASDLRGVQSADVFFAVHVGPSAGMHVELGASLALDVPVVGCGDPSFFGSLAWRWFESTGDLLDAIRYRALVADLRDRSTAAWPRFVPPARSLSGLQAHVHAVAREKGWWDDWPEGLVFCEGCGSYVDPGTCGCGSPRDYGHEGHPFIPYGCDCHRNKRPERPTRDERERAARVIVQLALISCEASEAIEEVRAGRFEEIQLQGKPEGLPAELADIVIRCLDLAGGLGIDLGAAIDRKVAFNETRPKRHGGKLA